MKQFSAALAALALALLGAFFLAYVDDLLPDDQATAAASAPAGPPIP